MNTREAVLSQMQMFENYSSEILYILKNWILLAGKVPIKRS